MCRCPYRPWCKPPLVPHITARGGGEEQDMLDFPLMRDREIEGPFWRFEKRNILAKFRSENEMMIRGLFTSPLVKN